MTLIDPGGTGPNGITPEERRVGVSAPKMFGFDGIFSEDDDQVRLPKSFATFNSSVFTNAPNGAAHHVHVTRKSLREFNNIIST